MDTVKGLMHDPVARVATAVFVAVFVPYFFPILDSEQLKFYANVYAFIPLLILTVFASQYNSRSGGSDLDRLFWQLWAIGYAMWLLVRIVYVFLYVVIPRDMWVVQVDLLIDFLYVLFYLSVIFALSVEPDRRPFWDTPRNLGSLENAGLSVLFLGLWVYFAIIPSVLNFVAYDSWIPSLLLFVALDTYVFMRCLNLWRSSTSPLWKPTYAWLSVTAVLLLITDLFEAMDYAEWLPIVSPGTLLDIFWAIPLMMVVFASRVFYMGLDDRGHGGGGAAPADPTQRGRLFGGALVVGALIMPVVHFTCYSLGLLDPGTQTIRGFWVLLVLVCLLAMEVVNQQLIERKNRQLKISKEIAEERRKLLATAVEEAGESIIITDAAGVIEYVNPAFEISMGYPATEVVGQSTRILKSGIHDSDFYRVLWTTVLGGEVWQGRLVNRRKDGSLCEQTASIAPVIDESGEVVRCVAVERDITRQVQMERQLGESHKMKALGTLAGGIAHDFNNILQAITGYSEILRDDLPEHSGQREKVDMVLRSAERAKGIIKQILSFARKPKEEREPTDVPVLINETVALLRASLPSTIEIEIDVAFDAGNVLADPHQLHQVLLNLGSNAAHAIGDQPGRLGIGAARLHLDGSSKVVLDGLPEGEYVEITVSDSGAGMDVATLDRIYEPFYTTKEVGSGTGLGLSVVHGIVHSHRGAIEVESEVGKGTTFRIYLPIHQVTEKPSSGSYQLNGVERGTGHVLVVDDEQPILDLVRNLLERVGYTVTVAHDGNEGLSAFESNRDAFDAIITDQTMPGRTGLQFAREVRKSRKDLPLILITGYSRVITDEKALEAGIGAVLTKPFTATELVATLEEVRNRKSI